jgi:predicted PurR-regulated permease PerM
MASRTVERRLQKPRLDQRASREIVQAQEAPSAALEVLKLAWPILSGIGKVLLIVVLLGLLLYARRDLRDRLVRLAARARIPVAAHAIETATGAAGR